MSSSCQKASLIDIVIALPTEVLSYRGARNVDDHTERGLPEEGLRYRILTSFCSAGSVPLSNPHSFWVFYSAIE
jgi:hypothetical protein